MQYPHTPWLFKSLYLREPVLVHGKTSLIYITSVSYKDYTDLEQAPWEGVVGSKSALLTEIMNVKEHP